jgi:hypothetical protein
MTIDHETLMAYADDELDPLMRKRVERAMAEDATLAETVARQQALTARLRGAFAGLDTQPMPATVETLLRDSAKVIALSRAARSPTTRRWLPAMAASLVAGLLIGQLVPRTGSDLTMRDGVTVAGGSLARALDTQLASAQPADSPVRIGLTFRNVDRALCRTFEQAGTAGIACSTDGPWRIERLYGGQAAGTAAYRQAGSPAAAMMVDAQAMIAGEAMDAAQERAALALHR